MGKRIAMKRAWKNAHRAGRKHLSKRDFKLGSYKGSRRKKGKFRKSGHSRIRSRRSRRSGSGSGRLVNFKGQSAPTSLPSLITNPEQKYMDPVEFMEKQNIELKSMIGKSTEDIEKRVRDVKIEKTISDNNLRIASIGAQGAIAEQAYQDRMAAMIKAKQVFDGLDSGEAARLAAINPGLAGAVYRTQISHKGGLGFTPSKSTSGGVQSGNPPSSSSTSTASAYKPIYTTIPFNVNAPSTPTPPSQGIIFIIYSYYSAIVQPQTVRGEYKFPSSSPFAAYPLLPQTFEFYAPSPHETPFSPLRVTPDIDPRPHQSPLLSEAISPEDYNLLSYDEKESIRYQIYSMSLENLEKSSSFGNQLEIIRKINQFKTEGIDNIFNQKALIRYFYALERVQRQK